MFLIPLFYICAATTANSPKDRGQMKRIKIQDDQLHFKLQINNEQFLICMPTPQIPMIYLVGKTGVPQGRADYLIRGLERD